MHNKSNRMKKKQWVTLMSSFVLASVAALTGPEVSAQTENPVPESEVQNQETANTVANGDQSQEQTNPAPAEEELVEGEQNQNPDESQPVNEEGNANPENTEEPAAQEGAEGSADEVLVDETTTTENDPASADDAGSVAGASNDAGTEAGSANEAGSDTAAGNDTSGNDAGTAGEGQNSGTGQQGNSFLDNLDLDAIRNQASQAGQTAITALLDQVPEQYRALVTDLAQAYFRHENKESLPYSSQEVDQIVAETVRQIPQFVGPVPSDENSYQFSAMARNIVPINLADHGYTEEEYFMSGTANVYQGDSDVEIVQEDLPYTTRIVVRKPSPENFSGRVYIDILNASNGYDVEGLWYRTFEHLMDNNHGYIGVTSKPNVVAALKEFDPERYASLDWANPETANMIETPLSRAFGSIPGQEEGLVWDMLSQLGHLVKTNQAEFFDGYQVDNVYLTGQSQSAMYLNTYANYFGEYLEDVYDGFLSTVGAGRMRTLRQDEVPILPVKNQEVGDHTIPHIQMAAHGDVHLLKAGVDLLESMAFEEPYMRVYEVPGSPHSDPTSDIAPLNEDIVKAGRSPRTYPEDFDFVVNDLQLSYYVTTALEALHDWATQGTQPKDSVLLDRDAEGNPILDEHKNGTGGVMSPYLQVPVARYQPNAVPAGEDPDQLTMSTNGSMIYFTPEKLNELYGNKQNYLDQFKQAVDQQVADGWLLPTDAEKMVQWSQETADKLFVEETPAPTPGDGPATPGGDDQTPGGDDQTPGGDDQTPGGDDQTPGGDDQTPGGDDQTPDGDDQTPGGDDQTPGGDDQTPGGDDQTPGGDDQTPGGDDQTPGQDDQTPGQNDRTPDRNDGDDRDDRDDNDDSDPKGVQAGRAEASKRGSKSTESADPAKLPQTGSAFGSLALGLSSILAGLGLSTRRKRD